MTSTHDLFQPIIKHSSDVGVSIDMQEYVDPAKMTLARPWHKSNNIDIVQVTSTGGTTTNITDVAVANSAVSSGHMEEIELKDMTDIGSGSRQGSPAKSHHHHLKDLSAGSVPHEGSSPKHKVNASKETLKENEDRAERFLNVAPPRSRPESPNKMILLKEVPVTSLSVPGKSPQRGSPKLLRPRAGEYSPKLVGNEDEDDISMEGLADLLGAVRQYAKEIHEIYAPIKKDEEERIRRTNAKNARRRSKEMKQNLSSPSEDQQSSSAKQEVRVEIHALEDKPPKNMRARDKRRLKRENDLLSKRPQQLLATPAASIHMENEKLASTWPRGHSKSPSREQFWSEMTLNRHRSLTPSSSRSFTRPQIPPDWTETSSAKHEQEILDKAFQRLYRANDVPPVGSSSKKLPVSQNMLLSSRQSVIEIARQHQQQRQNALPTISIIPPMVENRKRSLESLGGALPSTPSENDKSYARSPSPTWDSKSRDVIIPEATIMSGEVEGNFRRESKNGGAGVKSSVKAGLRRRKSTDQGQEHHVVELEKY